TCLFNCRQLIESADLEAWNDKSKKLEPIINLYTEAYDSPSTSIQNLFLNVCQALETYHARMVTNNRDEYLKKSNQKIARMNPSFKDFLIRNKRNTKSILLSERISDLMVVDNIPKINFSGGFKYFDFPQIVSNTRNYYTHYDENRQKNALFGEKLVDATELLRLILEYHLLRELGFNDDFATNNMRDSFGQINIHMGYFE
ncbi:HEPN domain-containing protein, partial [Liquorilactobacillus sicerae]